MSAGCYMMTNPVVTGMLSLAVTQCGGKRGGSGSSTSELPGEPVRALQCLRNTATGQNYAGKFVWPAQCAMTDGMAMNPRAGNAAAVPGARHATAVPTAEHTAAVPNAVLLHTGMAVGVLQQTLKQGW